VAGRQVRSLMVSAWLTNISNGALGKQMDIMLMSFFAVSYVAIGYYNLAYQLVSVVSVLLISGLGGISIAALSVAYAARGSARLVSMWRAILTLHILLAVPLQVLTFVLADQIIMTIYGERYAGSIPLLRIFLIFSIFGRMLGGGTNQSALYVLGKQRTVLMTRYTGFALNLILDVLLIQLAGPAGALVATGVAQLWVGAVEFIALRGTTTNHYPLNLALRVVAFALFAAIPTAFLPITGLFGLVSRSLFFGVLFVMAALVFRLGDSGDIVELAALNPRYQWLITLVTHHAARLPIRNRKAM
jgi:O-antigen/teichoic acid export membrane protein